MSKIYAVTNKKGEPALGSILSPEKSKYRKSVELEVVGSVIPGPTPNTDRFQINPQEIIDSEASPLPVQDIAGNVFSITCTVLTENINATRYISIGDNFHTGTAFSFTAASFVEYFNLHYGVFCKLELSDNKLYVIAHYLPGTLSSVSITFYNY